jgi:hypothetical protein
MDQTLLSYSPSYSPVPFDEDTVHCYRERELDFELLRKKIEEMKTNSAATTNYYSPESPEQSPRPSPPLQTRTPPHIDEKVFEDNLREASITAEELMASTPLPERTYGADQTSSRRNARRRLNFNPY